MVGRVTPVRAEIVRHRLRVEDSRPQRITLRAISPTRSRVRVRVQSAVLGC
jgi:hypothetical protein